MMNADGAMRQATWTAKVYLVAAIATIDEQLGEGYAKAHPELIAAFMNTAVRDYAAVVHYPHMEMAR